MNTVQYFEIQASEPPVLVKFYQEVFGWNFERENNQPIEYYRMMDTEGIMGAILKRPAKTPPMEFGTNAFTCSIQVAHFDETGKKILELGGQIAMPKFAVPGRCWQGYFVDPDNNVFGIFEADESAK
jgi:predicted enzyme related to lactoylglutathione lyase